eukprot:TRINITY_DN5774_c0_g1_i3.p4 TRINITY_DN5774_c0_g1~~TRINITY_DN5774_c0_g1_i3.p4  ORF type:complete len:117 (-),score=1.42 TRINITY_DN5774_c0_g1_i3:385-735(-)
MQYFYIHPQSCFIQNLQMLNYPTQKQQSQNIKICKKIEKIMQKTQTMDEVNISNIYLILQQYGGYKQIQLLRKFKNYDKDLKQLNTSKKKPIVITTNSNNEFNKFLQLPEKQYLFL